MKSSNIIIIVLFLVSCNGNSQKDKMENKMDPSVSALWKEFMLSNPKYMDQSIPEFWHFCDNQKDADECAQWVVDGIKQATSTSLWWYETNQHPLPKIGDLYIITNWDGIAKAIIQTTKVEKVPYNKVTQAYAEIEGEGDKSLAYWKKVHWDYYGREMKEKGESPTEDMLIVCEQFKTVWTGSAKTKSK